MKDLNGFKNQKKAKATFYLLAFSIPVVLVSSSFQGTLEAAQRFDLVNAVLKLFLLLNGKRKGEESKKSR